MRSDDKLVAVRNHPGLFERGKQCLKQERGWCPPKSIAGGFLSAQEEIAKNIHGRSEVSGSDAEREEF